ncbi:MAG TPA: DUF72 domain-containing protein [Candidatus Saccharimonadales bacterium]|nr:DUF72 domain-containing protein [Candidatus Saccharimonadales bacterium]
MYPRPTAFPWVLYSIMEGLYTGTSGWIYKGWAGSFYPPRLNGPDKFAFYATQFGTVEINNTFYRLPTEKAVRNWDAQAPVGFLYAVKGSRFITQMKKLNVDEKSLFLMLDRIDPLKKHLGPILWQLPPNFGINLERLERFLKMLPRRYKYAMEFRHPSWMDPRVFKLLERYNIAHASVSSLRMPMNLTVTGDFAYLRFHGLEGGAAHDYRSEELKPWAEHCSEALRHGMKVFAYFNNDINTRAPENAKMFISMVESGSRRKFKPRVSSVIAGNAF